MDNFQKKKEQTALISIIGNIVITIIKFIAFHYTQSIVVLAEAWHSTTDILTSLMVYFALKKDHSSEVNIKDNKGFIESLMNANYEIKSSILISGFIFMVGFSLLMRAFFEELSIINYSLESGFAFLFFSLLSYIIYRFETKAGKDLASPGLISDGLHSRSDALTSLVTGLSLFLYYLGTNIERLVASVISLIIIGFAIEVFINSIRAINKKEQIFDLKVNQLLFLIFTREFWMNLDKRLNLNIAVHIIHHRKKLYAFILFLLGVFYLSTSFFSVDTNSKAVVERLGVPLADVYDAGLYIKLPYPFDRVRKADVRAIKEIEIGNIIRQGSFALLWTKEHGTDQPFISGDNNLFYPYLTIHYDIYDIKDYLYTAGDPEEIFKDISHSVITEIFSKYSFFDIATYYRAEIPKIIRNDIQDYSDRLRLGIRVINIIINDVHPPIVIAKYYEDVIAAMQDKEMMVNRSMGFKNSNIPESRAEAIRIIQQAKAYTYERIRLSEASGESFLKIMGGSQKYPEIFKLYHTIDTLSKVYKKLRLIIVDHDIKMPDIWKFDKSIIGLDDFDPYKEKAVSQETRMTEEERRLLGR